MRRPDAAAGKEADPVNADQPWDRDWRWHYPHTVAEAEDEAAWSLVQESGFRPAVVYRARQRLRYQPPVSDPRTPNAWKLPGLPAYDDHYDSYLVSVHPSGHYVCTCWEHRGGEKRRRKICSHIVAVAIWRRARHAATVREVHDEADVGPEALVPSVATEEEDQQEPVPPSVVRRVPDEWSTPRDLGLPFDTFRGVQIFALKQILDAFWSGKTVVVVDAPTGSGKSLIAAAVARALGMPAIYTAPTKQLQQQFLTAFPGLAVEVKGRQNYVPLNYLPPEPGCVRPEVHDEHPDGRPPTCAECDLRYEEDEIGNKYPVCTFCHDPNLCPYLCARAAAFRSPFAVLNSSYFIHEAN